MARPKNGEARMLRMPKDLEDRIQKYRERFRKKTGVEISWSVAVRTLIEKGLTRS